MDQITLLEAEKELLAEELDLRNRQLELALLRAERAEGLLAENTFGQASDPQPEEPATQSSTGGFGPLIDAIEEVAAVGVGEFFKRTQTPAADKGARRTSPIEEIVAQEGVRIVLDAFLGRPKNN